MHAHNDVTNGGIDIELSESQVWEIRDLLEEHPKPSELYGAPSFFGVFENCVAESFAGSLVRKQAVLMDKWHGTEDMTIAQWENVILNLNARTGKGRQYSDLMTDVTNEVYGVLKENWDFMTNAAGHEAMADNGGLMEMAQELIRWKFIAQPYIGGQVEEQVADAICQNVEGATGWVAHSDAITQATGIESPEAKGIDVYITGLDTTVQIKTGMGGALEDCDADWVARYIHEEQDAHNWPYVEVREN